MLRNLFFIPNEANHENIEKLKKLLNEKYHYLKIEITSGTDNIHISLMNARHGLYEDIDEENKKPIEFLEAFGAKVSKKEGEHSYWSYSVITLEKAKLSDVINGLEKLPTPEIGRPGGKIFAKC